MPKRLIDLDDDLLAGTHLVELRLLEVRRNPQVGEWNDRQQVLADGKIRSNLHILLVDDSGHGSGDFCVAQVELRLVYPCLRRANIGYSGLRFGLLRLYLPGTILCRLSS